MIDVDKLVSSAWNLPVLQALRVEVLSHNLVALKTEKQLRDTLMNILEEDESSVERIMQLPPFKAVKDKRYQLFVKCWFHKPIWEIEAKGLEGDENTLFSEVTFWNWYSSVDKGKEDFKYRVTRLKDDPYYDADPCCMDLKRVKVTLIDTAYNRVLNEEYIM